MILTDAQLPDGRRADVTLADGRIQAIDPAGAVAVAPGVERHDCAGALLLPALVEGHVHLDKTLMGLPFMPHLPGDSVAERIAREKEQKRRLDMAIRPPAAALLAREIACGTTALRTHVDIDTEVRLNGLHQILALRAELADLIDIQIVAFPQSGIHADPGTADLLDAALSAGADLVGGLDPAGIDGDIAGHLDTVFGLAGRHGKGVDLHLHDRGTLGQFELSEIAARTRAAGLAGRVTVSHAFALGDPGDGGAVLDAMAEAAVAIMTSGPGPVAVPPIGQLRAAGVRVFAGNDNIRDAWSPYGDGDMLARAAKVGERQGILDDSGLEDLFAMATSRPAEVMELEGRALTPGGRADLMLVRAASVAEAVALHPPRALVIRAGQVVARDGMIEPDVAARLT